MPTSCGSPVCACEKTHIQALDRTQPELPMRAGSDRRLTATYKRHGTTCLLAALAVHSGEVSGRCVERNDHVAFLRFLKGLYRANPRRELHVILDNLSVHKHAEVLDWAGRRRRLTLHFTPTYASWLNQVERWFATLTEKYIRRGTHRSTRQLEQAIREYLKLNNADPKPFVWAKTAQDILASVERFCLRISNSGH